MNRFLFLRFCLALFLGALLVRPATPAGEPAGWKIEKAAKYLDNRGKAWFEFSSADRGEGATKTSCISCHTLFPYALARPVLRKLAGKNTPTDTEKKLIDQTRKRVEAWADLDAPAFGLLYAFSDQKKKESRGTEAILNAVILSFDDSYQGRMTLSDATKQAFDNLWTIQIQAGGDKGSWDWLDFRMEPWESKGARYYGAALAAGAVASAPGYDKATADTGLDGKVELLRGYLKGKFANQNLYNRAWALWAASKLDGVLTPEERNQVISQLLAKQLDDGGWSLPSLGAFVRSDGTPQDTSSDAYATGVILHILQTAGVAKDDPKVAKGLSWLRTHQADTGEWQGVSVNKKRDPSTHIGKFMSDAATAYAILALGH